VDATIHHPVTQQNQPLQPDPASMKLTRGTSCVLCQQRKVRCDKKKPCSNCAKAGVECRVVPPQPPRRRKKRLQEKDLLARLRKYENLLREHNIKFDGIDEEFRGNEVDDLENDFENLRTTPEDSASPASTTARFVLDTGCLTGYHMLTLPWQQMEAWFHVFFTPRSMLVQLIFILSAI
jgi:hypothetical protein